MTGCSKEKHFLVHDKGAWIGGYYPQDWVVHKGRKFKYDGIAWHLKDNREIHAQIYMTSEGTYERLLRALTDKRDKIKEGKNQEVKNTITQIKNRFIEWEMKLKRINVNAADSNKSTIPFKEIKSLANKLSSSMKLFFLKHRNKIEITDEQLLEQIESWIADVENARGNEQEQRALMMARINHRVTFDFDELEEKQVKFDNFEGWQVKTLNEKLLCYFFPFENRFLAAKFYERKEHDVFKHAELIMQSILVGTSPEDVAASRPLDRLKNSINLNDGNTLTALLVILFILITSGPAAFATFWAYSYAVAEGEFTNEIKLYVYAANRNAGAFVVIAIGILFLSAMSYDLAKGHIGIFTVLLAMALYSFFGLIAWMLFICGGGACRKCGPEQLSPWQNNLRSIGSRRCSTRSHKNPAVGITGRCSNARAS